MLRMDSCNIAEVAASPTAVALRPCCGAPRTLPGQEGSVQAEERAQLAQRAAVQAEAETLVDAPAILEPPQVRAPPCEASSHVQHHRAL